MGIDWNFQGCSLRCTNNSISTNKMEDENSNLRNPIVNARNGQFALIFKCIFNQFGVCKWRFLWPGKLKEKMIFAIVSFWMKFCFAYNLGTISCAFSSMGTVAFSSISDDVASWIILSTWSPVSMRVRFTSGDKCGNSFNLKLYSHDKLLSSESSCCGAVKY